MNNIFVNILNLLDPEMAHKFAIYAIASEKIENKNLSKIPIQLGNLKFQHPIGLAAGFDKSAECFSGAFRLGFSSVEIGTVTPLPQSGNNKPRIFRLKEYNALINRYGFNNDGMAVVIKRIKKKAISQKGILGVNIGPNKNSQNPLKDFNILSSRLSNYADYLAINISSPNTPGLRSFHEKSSLVDVIDSCIDGIKKSKYDKPIFLKISPDITSKELEDVIDVSIFKKIDALIISNTTVYRDEKINHKSIDEKGGLSGKPLFLRSSRVLEKARIISEGKISLIGVGGVETAEHAYAKILIGASLIQIYTSFVYKGPEVLQQILYDLLKFMHRDGFKSLSEAVGVLDFKEAMKINNIKL